MLSTTVRSAPQIVAAPLKDESHVPLSQAVTGSNSYAMEMPSANDNDKHCSDDPISKRTDQKTKDRCDL